MSPAEERIQAQKAKEAQLQKCADQKEKFLAELKQTGKAGERAGKNMQDDKRVDIKSADNEKEDPEQCDDDMLQAAYERYLGEKPRVTSEVLAEILNSMVDNVFEDKSTAAAVNKEDESSCFNDKD